MANAESERVARILAIGKLCPVVVTWGCAFRVVSSVSGSGFRHSLNYSDRIRKPPRDCGQRGGGVGGAVVRPRLRPRAVYQTEAARQRKSCWRNPKFPPPGRRPTAESRGTWLPPRGLLCVDSRALQSSRAPRGPHRPGGRCRETIPRSALGGAGGLTRSDAASGKTEKERHGPPLVCSS